MSTYGIRPSRAVLRQSPKPGSGARSSLGLLQPPLRRDAGRNIPAPPPRSASPPRCAGSIRRPRLGRGHPRPDVTSHKNVEFPASVEARGIGRASATRQRGAAAAALPAIRAPFERRPILHRRFCWSTTGRSMKSRQRPLADRRFRAIFVIIAVGIRPVCFVTVYRRPSESPRLSSSHTHTAAGRDRPRHRCAVRSSLIPRAFVLARPPACVMRSFATGFEKTISSSKEPNRSVARSSA